MLHNDAFLPILGEKPPSQGRFLRDVFSEVYDEIGPIARLALDGEATFIENYPLVLTRHGYPEQCHFTFCYSPVRNERGEVEGIMHTVIETSEMVKAQRDLEVMNAELLHRSRNIYALVSAIARQTLKKSLDPEEAWAKLSQRFFALAEAQSALKAGAGARATVHDVVAKSLAPHIEAQPPMEGPTILLGERETLALALAVNELATNAQKHGAMVSDGAIRISWALDGDQFTFRWLESGIPGPDGKGRVGFGRQLLQTIIPADFRGSAKIEHDAGRMEYCLTGQLNP